ncbi:hypothetical protein FACS189434_06040 [Bacteroidia bacterium]|nr:hypothetical protein FACS189434_06040 [Bacteroidia bacterium]
MKQTIIILLTALLLGGCLKDEVPFLYTIKVSVKDANNAPIENAEVTLRCTTTGKRNFPVVELGKGIYEFRNLTDTGTYQIWASKDDFDKDDNKQVYLTENKTNTVELTLTNY